MTPHIRWMIRRDEEAVLDIERRSFEFPWSHDDLIRCLRSRNVIAMVAECEQIVAGFMIYELQETRLEVINFAVHPEWRRLGIGSAMAAKLIGKLSPQRRCALWLMIRETNLAAQLFFARQGFRYESTLRDFYQDNPCDDDAYLFEYRLLRPAFTQGGTPSCSST